MLAALRSLSCCLGIALAVQWCGATAERPGIASTTTLTPETSRQVESIAPLIRALLDTSAASTSRAASLRLLAGKEVRQLYAPDFAPVWTSTQEPLGASAAAAINVLARATEYGLRPNDYGVPRLQALWDSLASPGQLPQRAAQQAQLEVYLSDGVLRFMRDLRRGRLHPYTISPAEKAAGPAGQPVVMLRDGLRRSAVPAAMVAGQPQNREYRLLQQALARWLATPSAQDSLAKYPARYQQVAVNLERWRWEAFAPDSDYVLINVPAYELQVVAAGVVERRHRVIVGKPGTTTPTLTSSIRYFTLAPGWHVPHSIATQEMLPRIKQDAGYLERNNLAVYNDRGRQLDPARIDWTKVTAQHFPYTVRQSAGCDNALGNIVFRFTNPYSVYVHDTPLRQLFDRPTRALSHGCIRLEHPMQLAAYLLGREGNLARLPTEDECARSPVSRDIRLRRPMALFVRYATCTAENGRLRFLPDIYGRDEVLRRGLFGPKLPVRAGKALARDATSTLDTAEFVAK
ncbi:L,D-transpeptidase scaffold domain-containing protein [Hymenobacter guriensis]|uniref:L,D-transpeptidase family protein n=1 Tax=Hymenobacter guriensis TaxID=2793065 RepID=A0ABS0L8M7_9BACT|nr:L,D-transpeptidase family protein [Hymenobacter guriensis]MBG8556275.1 L,D-transpeptidase family protein [Hymenobacter guriensis]